MFTQRAQCFCALICLNMGTGELSVDKCNLRYIFEKVDLKVI